MQYIIQELQIHEIELGIQNEELTKKQNELEESRFRYMELYEKYADLYDFAPVGYFTLGGKAILEANLTGAALLGAERDDLIGQPLTRFILKEDLDAFHFHRMKVSDTKDRQHCEIRMKKADGTLFHAHLESVTQPDRDEIWRTALSDVSERVRLESRLRQSHKMEAVGTLAGGIAHEFNNILFPLIGYAQMGMRETPEESLMRTCLEEILRAAGRAKNAVSQILDFSRPDDRGARPLRLQKVISESLGLLRGALPANIEIRQNVDVNAGTVTGNHSRLCQVMLNLCTNASHAMEDGGTLTVSLVQVDIGPDDADNTELRPGDYIRLTVSDTGQGMEPAVRERIFEPYFTTKPVGKGTGMGLATVHGIVEKHGGKISVFSKPGEGAAFHVYLPVFREDIPEPETGPSDPLPRGEGHILFVDDEADNLSIAERMLASLGYQVTALTCSTEALKVFSAHPEKFDVVITDLTMPGLAGHELARELRIIRPDIPIILCTGFGKKMAEEAARAAGIQDILMKPVTVEDMAGTVSRVLSRE